MTDYTITTDFGAKDSLPSGNAAKVIKGSEFTAEFTNIKTAVNSKADSISPTFTGDTALNGTTTFGPDGTSTFNGTVNFTKDVTFDTNTMFVDVSENKVGIGTTNPAESLHTSGNIRLGDTTPAELYTNSNELRLGVDKNNDNDASTITFYTNNDEKVRIEKDGKVGIGTDNPATSLTVAGSQANGLELDRNGADNTQSCRLFFDSTTSGYSVFNNGGALAFCTGAVPGSGSGTEKMRFDSSGKLLIGKTEESVINTVGIEAHPAGLLIATRDGNIPLIANRKTDNGAILQLRKDGEPVGSIGTIDDEIYIESGDVGLQFDASGNDIVPYGGGYRDATIDLGSSTNRFKDLYLSGGVYLGGTGSANKLDDYEEGSWTAGIRDNSSNVSSSTTTTCRYVKVGDVVTVTGEIININKGSLSTTLQVFGLPFTVKTGTGRPHGSIQLNNFNTDFADKGVFIQGIQGQTYFTIKVNQRNLGAGLITGNTLAEDNSSDILFSLTFIVN